MSAAGESRSTVGAFFHRSRRWAEHILRNYSSESFSPVSVKNCEPERKTTREEDQLIVQKGREKAHAPVRAVLAEENQETNQPSDGCHIRFWNHSSTVLGGENAFD